MKLIRIAAILFAFGSTIFWTAISGLQFAAWESARGAPLQWAVSIWAAASFVPFLVYALGCFFLFHWLKRRIAKVLATQKD
jgi:hypothetical protein